jgi:hypothetical protein
MPASFTQEQTDKHLASVVAAAEAVDSVIAGAIATDGMKEEMARHIRHIEIMCGMQHIKNSGADLKPYTDAAARGSAWLAQN